MVAMQPFFGQRKAVVYIADNVCLSAKHVSDVSGALWGGIRTVKRPPDCDLLAVVGDSRESGFVSTTHDLVDPDLADGFLAWRSRSAPDCTAYFERFSPSPLVFLSVRHGDHPLVSIPNAAGILAIMHHFIEDHGCRHIAYIGGPATHWAAQERLQAYRAGIEAHGLIHDPALELPPAAWSAESGRQGVATLLDTQGLRAGIDVDAIVCVNDQIAMAAMTELERRGIAIPGQIRLAGYNNTREARTHTPSLTTVAPPFHQQGQQAMQQLLGLLGYVATDAVIPLESQIIPGESCGCGEHFTRPGGVLDTSAGVSSLDVLSQRLQVHLDQMMTPDEASVCALQIAQASEQLWASGDVAGLTGVILPRLRPGYFGLMDQVFWQRLFGDIHLWLVGHSVTAHRPLATELVLEGVRAAIADCYSREQGKFVVQENKLSVSMRLLGMGFSLAANAGEMMNGLAAKLDELDIHSIWVVLYDQPPQNGRVCETSRLLLAVESSERYSLPDAGLPFKTRQLIPEGFRRENAPGGTFVLMPLMYADQEYGFVIFGQSSSADQHETLATLIANGLLGLQTREALIEKGRQLEQSAQQLGAVRQHMEEADKMAALGELVAGMAHEINTPIGVGVMAISSLADEVKGVRKKLDNKEPLPLRRVLDTLKEASEIAMNNMLRAAGLINNFKLIAVDQTRNETRTIALAVYLQEIVLSLRPRLKAGGHTVQVDCPPDIKITCDPSTITRIFTNLVVNSVVHGFEGRKEGHIQIECKQSGQRLEILYQDNGLGMSQAIQDKMFDPFFTTKQGQGGTGLGMSIVHQLVADGLHGDVRCESSPGNGTRFYLSIPV